MCHDEGCSLLKVSTSALSGNTIYEDIFPIDARIGHPVTSVLQQLGLPFRVAEDHNLYTRADFDAHYGPDEAEKRWTYAESLQGCSRTFLTEGGAILHPEANEAFLVTLIPRSTR